jgi:hypothetical protein
MSLAPADFYAYSRATGTPFPESAEERASLAPNVLDFRRNQLKSNQTASTGPDPLSLGIGIGLGLAGIGGAGLAARRMFRSGKATGQSGVQTADLSKYNKETIQRAAGIEVPPSQQAPNLVDIQQSNVAPVLKQQQTAVEAGSNQSVNRLNKKLQRNEDVDTASVGEFLARQRDEIASELGEQGLIPSPLRIERELAERTGANAWQYGPEFTKQKQALELGTQDPRFLADPEQSQIKVGGLDWEVGLKDLMQDDPSTAFRRPFINSDTAVRAEEQYQNQQNKIKDWLGSVRLDAQQDTVAINNERKVLRQRMNQLREEENMLLSDMAQSPGNRMRNEPRLNIVQEELEDIVNRFDQGEQVLSRANNRIEGAREFAADALQDVTKQLPSTLTDWTGEGFIVRPKGETTSTFITDEGKVMDVVQAAGKMADFGPEDLEVVSGRRKVVDNLIRDPETGALMEAASGTSIRGRTGIPFIPEANVQETGLRAREAASKIAYVDSLKPTGAATTNAPATPETFGSEARGGIGIYGIEAEGFPAGAVTREGDYTYQATQRPTRTYGEPNQSPPDVLIVDRATGQRQATRQAPPLKRSPLLEMPSEQLNEMVMMGEASGGEAALIGAEADRVLRNRGETSALERQAQRRASVDVSEQIRRLQSSNRPSAQQELQNYIRSLQV